MWSDINCPFCYIGKRHLEKALERYSKKESVEVIWKSFELDPVSHPPKGSDQTELLAKKYGRSLEWAREMNQNMTQMAREAGLEFRMDQLIPANSFKAHRLIHLALSVNLQDQMKERLLKARFTEGMDLGDDKILLMLAGEVGIEESMLTHFFESQKFVSEVRKDEEVAKLKQISGVPFFVFNSQYAISGARPVEDFLRILEKL